MPNHCSNFLTVVGDPTELSEFVKVSKNSAGEQKEYSIFQNNYPCPQELFRRNTQSFRTTTRVLRSCTR